MDKSVQRHKKEGMEQRRKGEKGGGKRAASSGTGVCRAVRLAHLDVKAKRALKELLLGVGALALDNRSSIEDTELLE